MADAASARIPSGSIRSQRNPRVQGGASRNPSARASAVYSDDYMQPQPHGYGSLGLRRPPSRYSLNEQFAATRREIDFGFDDGSSMFDRSTIAEDDGDDTIIVGATSGSLPTTGRDFYDILCLPRSPSAESIRRAYFRLSALLYPEMHPPKLQAMADGYFALVHTAFETLIDPVRRLEFDLECDGASTYLQDDTDQYHKYRLRYNEALRHRLLSPAAVDGHGSLELGFMLNVEDLHRRSKSGRGRRESSVKPLDFAMSQTFSAALPELGEALDRTGHSIQNLLRLQPQTGSNKIEASGERQALSPRTLLSIKGSIYGFLQDLISIPVSVVADPYQPSIPTYIPRERALQLLDGRVRPLVAVKLQHQFPPTRPAESNDDAAHLPGVTVELESDILPEPALSIGVTKHVFVPGDTNSSIFQVAAKSSIWRGGIPRVGATLQRPTTGGMVQCKISSGDWAVRPEETCHAFTQFSKINRKFLSLDIPIRTAPQVELAYKSNGSRRLINPCLPERLAEGGLRGLDWDVEHDGSDGQGSWTVSTTAEPYSLGASVKYAVDVDVLSRTTRLVPEPAHQPGRRFGRGVRVEAELSSNSTWTRFLGFRCLKRIGRFSKLGFEIGLSSYNLHLSLYWSRLGQRIRLPFFISPTSSMSNRVLFWTTFVPFATFAAWELLAYHQRAAGHNRQEPDQGLVVQQRRAEADEVTLLMSASVEARQDVERATRGLVILSAKYGVKGDGSWGAAEVADVTTALAAIADNGQLHIPHGVRKSNILGFWDPVPGTMKTLHVRYLYQSREGTVEVNGEEELRLPPVS
jgi:DnaJ family protein C protein 11